MMATRPPATSSLHRISLDPYDISQRPRDHLVINKNAPDHVKRPMNPFMLWCQKKRGELLKTQPGIKPAEISKQLGEVWRNMTDEDKKPFKDEANKLKTEHEKNHPDYRFRPQRKQKKTSNKPEPTRPPSSMTPTSSSMDPATLHALQIYPGMNTAQSQNLVAPVPLMSFAPQPYPMPFNIGLHQPVSSVQNIGIPHSHGINGQTTGNESNPPMFF